MRKFTSPVARFPGEIALPDALTFAQFSAWRNAILAAEEQVKKDAANIAAADREVIAGALVIVSEWHIEGLPTNLTVDNFPATPRKSSNALVGWIVRCVSAMVSEEEEIPKA